MKLHVLPGCRGLATSAAGGLCNVLEAPSNKAPSNGERSTAPGLFAVADTDVNTGWSASTLWVMVPEAVLLLVVGQLSLRETAAAACVCSSWYSAITATDDIWQQQQQQQLLGKSCRYGLAQAQTNACLVKNRGSTQQQQLNRRTHCQLPTNTLQGPGPLQVLFDRLGV